VRTASTELRRKNKSIGESASTGVDKKTLASPPDGAEISDRGWRIGSASVLLVGAFLRHADRKAALLARVAEIEAKGMAVAVESSMLNGYVPELRGNAARFAAFRARWLGNDPASYATIYRMLVDMELAYEKSALVALHRLFNHKYYVDELYDGAFVRPTTTTADLLADEVDPHVIDGLVNGAAGGIATAGMGLWAGPSNDRGTEPEFRKYFEAALASGGALTILDRVSGRIVGCSRYHGHDPERRRVEIGYTFLVRSCWGGAVNGEFKRLMLAQAFRFVATVQFAVAESNVRSQRACEKIGANWLSR